MPIVRPYRPLRLIFGSTRLRVAIPALFILLPLVFGVAVSLVIDLLIEAYPQKQVLAALTQVRLYVVIIVILNSVLGLLLGLAVVYAAIRPMEQIDQLAKQMAEGRFDERLIVGQGADEIGSLGRSFNTMVDTLHAMFSERNRYMMENVAGALLTLSLDGDIASANEAATELIGAREGDIVGRNLLELLRQQPMNAPLCDALEGCLREGKSLFSRQSILVNRQGEAIAILVSTTLLRSGSGEPFNVVVNLQNLDRLRDLYRRINRADRLAAIGTLAMGMAHEVRNPLGAIKGLTQLLLAETTTPSEARDYGRVILREVERLDRLLTELMAFADPKGITLNPVDLGALVVHVNETARLKLAVGTGGAPRDVVQIDDVPKLPLPGDKIHQAVLNIVLNAYEAAAEGGGEVHLRLCQPDPSRVRLIVHNTGSRIPEHLIDKVYEPFYTTKEGGTGLGLAIAYQILSYAGANLQLRSGDNDVTFTIDFPLLRVGEGPKPDPLRARAEAACDTPPPPSP